jgi:Protein of unknown function (DUF3617)
MTTRAARGILLTATLSAIIPLLTQAAEPIRGGEWQFTTHIQLPAGMPQPGGGQGMTQTTCINSANPVPADAQCKLDNVDRNGGVVTWTMTCGSPIGPIQSAGSARYVGDTMEATLTTRIPDPNGKPTDAPGTITGHYIGPCAAR